MPDCTNQDHIEAREMTDLLAALVEKSLVVLDESTGRHRLLESVRQYSSDRLLETGGGGRGQDRHLRYFVGLAEEAEPHLAGANQKTWLERSEQEHDNFRAALDWSEGANPEAGLKLAAAMTRFWTLRGHFAEGRRRLTQALAGAPDAEEHIRAKGLNGAGALAHAQSDYAAARSLFEESLVIKREVGDRLGVAASLNNLGNVSQRQGDYAGARALHEESLAIKRELDDRPGIAASLGNLAHVAHTQGDYAVARALCEESLLIQHELGDRWGIADSLNNLANVAYEQGDHAAARELNQESLEVYRRLGERSGIANSLGNLGRVAVEQADYIAARTLFEDSLAILRELGDRHGIATSLTYIPFVEVALGNHVRAAQLWGAAERLREEIGSPLTPSERTRYERLVAAARAALEDSQAFDAAWRKGRTMTLESVISGVLENDSA